MSTSPVRLSQIFQLKLSCYCSSSIAAFGQCDLALAVSGLGAMAQSANDRALPFPAPPGLDAEAPALSSTHQAVCQAVLQDVEAKVNEKMEEVWQKGRQMLTQVQQKQQEKTDQLVAELRQLQERQEALQTEHESLKQMLVLAASQLALLGAGVGDAKAMRGLSPTTAGTDSVHSITPQRSDLNTAGTEELEVVEEEALAELAQTWRTSDGKAGHAMSTVGALATLFASGDHMAQRPAWFERSSIDLTARVCATEADITLAQAYMCATLDIMWIFDDVPADVDSFLDDFVLR
ncbi:hypothetical protein AK812_SmicGene2640 [Symbiodinium microadriaticum]|uniref:Uncharacterized protein n=1 Tax=Symbiodinium microadriaticum TaxID=2951 RepID=A0A1Q9F175_SYMMI|nr:hypothetical protein AK812_SmicGene2640 [Symbiodinium microadriaticum]